jgi:type IV pilus assembly protein PilX
VILITGLVMLVIVMLLSMVAIKTPTLQEKMAGSFVDQNHAFQAAETALRQGERALATAASQGAGWFDVTEGNPAPRDLDDYSVWMKANNSIAAVTDYYESVVPPRYMIEKHPNTSISSRAGAPKDKEVYKINAIGVGGEEQSGKPTSIVVLQSSIIR